MRTSSKNTSLNEAPPLIWRIGTIVIPGVSIGSMNAVCPACLGTAGSVRAISSPQAEKRAPELHVFCPLTTHSSPSRTARVDSPARSEPAPGSENSWQHSSVGAQEARDQLGLLLRRAERPQRGGDEVQGDTERLVVAGRGEVRLLVVEGLLERCGETGATELGRPADRAVAAVELLALPRHRPFEQRPLLVVGEVVEHADVVGALAPALLARS